MIDFWKSCGYSLLQVDALGHLQVTDDFLRRYWLRPELAPIETSCAHERRLHEMLLEQPRRPVSELSLQQIQDADARENYRITLRFRERLLNAESLDACYFALFAGEGTEVPPVFVFELTQILLRHILRDSANALEARAAEMLFRPQKISYSESAVMAADSEYVEHNASGAGFGPITDWRQPEVAPQRSVDVDVLTETNCDAYWERDERFDTALALNADQPAIHALCRVLERWINHFLAVEVAIRPRTDLTEPDWLWHTGLDAEATGILNDLYKGEDVDESRMQHLLCLFQVDFQNPADMLPEIAGHPVYLGMAMTAQHLLKLKPQNLLRNLPLAACA